MLSLLSKNLSDLSGVLESELKSVLPAETVSSAVKSWFSKLFPFLEKKAASLVDLSGTVALAEDLSGAVVSAKSWFSRFLSPVPSVPASPPVLKVAKNDLVVVTVSLPSVWRCSQYDLKVAVSLPELVKPAAPVPESVNPAAPVPESVNNLQIYDSIEKVRPPTPPPSTQTSPESEKNEVAEQIQDTPPE